MKNKFKMTFVSVLLIAIVSLGLTGCKDDPEHPTSEHPAKESIAEEHPASEHPAGEHPK
jgi:hypothetical protein